jgi:hypothetical protein
MRNKQPEAASLLYLFVTHLSTPTARHVAREWRDSTSPSLLAYLIHYLCRLVFLRREF